MVGMESTGHYWLSIYTFVYKLGFHTTVFNPIQSDVLRGFYIWKTKNDTIDALLIAKVIRLDLPDKTELPAENIFRLKQLERFRYDLVDRCSELKRKILACLDQIFSDVFGCPSTQVLLDSPIPEDLLEIDTERLIETINTASEKG